MAGPIVSIPLKAVVAWWPLTANEAPPTGWAIANGQVLTNPATVDQQLWVQQVNPGSGAAWTTPDMRNKQILGADPTIGTTTTSGSHTLPVGTINVQTNGALTFPSAGVLNVNNGQMVTYTGKTASTFTGCTGGSGVVNAGSLVTFAGLAVGNANINATSGAPGIKGEWGSNKANLTSDTQIPAHDHSQGTQTGTSVTANPAHTHTNVSNFGHSHGGTTQAAWHGHNIGFNVWTFENTGIPYAWISNPSGSNILFRANLSTNTDGAHYHSFSSSGGHSHTMSDSGSHNHPGTTATTGNTLSVGTGEAHDNRGLYVGLTYIVKVKY
jgi:hypothetical protein